MAASSLLRVQLIIVSILGFTHSAFAANNTLELLADADCQCYLINGSVPTYYSKHMFFDFRWLSEYAGVPDIVDDETDAAEAGASSDYFRSDNWTDVWDLQTWDNSYGPGKGLSNGAGVLMVNSKSNVYIEQNDDEKPASDTWMTLRTKRLKGFQTASEFQSVKKGYQFVSLRMLARTLGAEGAVTGMFTYRGADKLAHVQEADIEILTAGPKDKIQYTNQPSYTDDGTAGDIPAATRNASMPTGLKWSDWVVHRLDWTPKESIWYVDGQEVARIAFQTPRDSSEIHVSAWSDGGTWSKNMTLGEQAVQQVQWIEAVYNGTAKPANVVGAATSSSMTKEKRDETYGEVDHDMGPAGKLLRKRGGHHHGGCKVVCSIDETRDVGTPAMLWNNTASWRTVGGGVFAGKGMWTSTAVLAFFSWLLLC